MKWERVVDVGESGREAARDGDGGGAARNWEDPYVSGLLAVEVEAVGIHCSSWTGRRMRAEDREGGHAVRDYDCDCGHDYGRDYGHGLAVVASGLAQRTACKSVHRCGCAVAVCSDSSCAMNSSSFEELNQ